MAVVGATNVPQTGSRTSLTAETDRAVAPPRTPSITPSIRRQNNRVTMMNRMTKRTNRSIGPPLAAGRCSGGWSGARALMARRRDAFEPFPGRLRFRAVRRQRNHLLPCRFGTGQVLLAKREHDSLIQHGLRVPRIDRQGMLELFQSAVCLSGVVVADTQIGAGVRVLGIEPEALFIPLDGVRIPFGIEVGVRELDDRPGVLGVALEDSHKRLNTAFIQRGGLPGRRLSLGGSGGDRCWSCPVSRLLGSDDPAQNDPKEHSSDGKDN